MLAATCDWSVDCSIYELRANKFKSLVADNCLLAFSQLSASLIYLYPSIQQWFWSAHKAFEYDSTHDVDCSFDHMLSLTVVGKWDGLLCARHTSTTKEICVTKKKKPKQTGSNTIKTRAATNKSKKRHLVSAKSKLTLINHLSEQKTEKKKTNKKKKHCWNQTDCIVSAHLSFSFSLYHTLGSPASPFDSALYFFLQFRAIGPP